MSFPKNRFDQDLFSIELPKNQYSRVTILTSSPVIGKRGANVSILDSTGATVYGEDVWFKVGASSWDESLYKYLGTLSGGKYYIRLPGKDVAHYDFQLKIDTNVIYNEKPTYIPDTLLIFKSDSLIHIPLRITDPEGKSIRIQPDSNLYYHGMEGDTLILDASKMPDLY